MVDVRVPYVDLDEVLVQVSQVRELFESASGSTAGAESIVGVRGDGAGRQGHQGTV